MNEDDLLLTSEVARLGEVSPECVRLWANADWIPYLRTPSGVRLFRRGDVEHYLNDRRASGRQRYRPTKRVKRHA